MSTEKVIKFQTQNYGHNLMGYKSLFVRPDHRYRATFKSVDFSLGAIKIVTRLFAWLQPLRVVKTNTHRHSDLLA